MGGATSNFFSQSWPPKPSFTEQSLSSLQGKVFIVTGGASGVGFELVKLLYQKEGTVYVAGRSEQNGITAIKQVLADVPSSKGKIEFLHLDLSDLAGIQKSAETFTSKQNRLDVLWNNAGVMIPPKGSKSKQDHELQLATNCLGPLLFTQLLLPLMQTTAKSAPANSVRVIWTGSLTVDLQAPKGGVVVDELKAQRNLGQDVLYAESKCGNVFLASEFAKVSGKDGIVSVDQSLNPGNLKSPLQRHMPAYQRFVLNPLLHDPVYGAYTELFAGLSPDVTTEQNGAALIPWGRFHDFSRVRPDIAQSLKSESEGQDDLVYSDT
ncbi:MAG: hypothetical protein M1838_001886 [Thelocarpon superellum]|nr:MAG: hypothetical protein M1838_001886 [Thelocarpon superellum]